MARTLLIGESNWWCSMRSSWRSWFWNIAALVLLAIMTGLLISVAVDRARHGAWPVAIGFGIGALWTGTAMVRSLFVGVFARPRGVVMRGLWRTKTIPWNEITEFTSGRLNSGAAGTVGARTVVVMRSRPGVDKPKSVELNVLGGYGLSPVRTTPAERAIADLMAHLEKWRDRQAPETP